MEVDIDCSYHSSFSPVRKIIHVDMDAFYASVEQRDQPDLKGKPVVVGWDPNSRGVVASASYEARKFGIRSAMSCAQAYRLCPHTVFVRPNIEKYVQVSRAIRAIFESVTPLVEPLSLDEAYLDVTSNLLGEPIARKLAIHIKERIYSELQLTASAGVGPNKFIAKLASDFKKPNGLVVIPPEKVAHFVENLPVEMFWGIGPVTAKKLQSLGLKTAADLRKKTVPELEKVLGSSAQFFFDLAHGIDHREVDPSFDPKSRGTETTFERDILDSQVLLQYLKSQSEEVAADLKRLDRIAKTITLKIKYSDFTLSTRSQTLFHPTDDEELIFQAASTLLFKDTQVGSKPVRLIGISAANFVSEQDPLQLWFDFFRKKVENPS